MRTSPALAPPSCPDIPPASSVDPPCRHCGGSGTLRMGDQQYRTCLDCLGRGRLWPAAANLVTFASLSAAVGVVDAR
jgi:hypothetical protein